MAKRAAPGAAPVGDDLLSNSEALAALLLGPFLFAAPPAARPAALEAFAAKVDELAQALRKGYYVQFEAAALLLCYEPPPGEAGEAAASPGASPAAADPPAASPPPPPPQRASARAAHGGGSGGVPPLLVCLANVEKPGMTRAKACHAGFLAAIERLLQKATAADVNKSTARGTTALCMAACKGSGEIVGRSDGAGAQASYRVRATQAFIIYKNLPKNSAPGRRVRFQALLRAAHFAVQQPWQT